jgi:hypothetical protein
MSEDKQLLSEARKAISRLEICELLTNLCDNQGKKEEENSGLIITEKLQKEYQKLYKVSMTVAEKIKGRVTITLPDGHVVIDTCKAEGNNYENYIDDVISENHNSRIAVLQAQLHPEGIGYEKKFSSTTFKREFYVAVRLGPFRNSDGTFRLSVPE